MFVAGDIGFLLLKIRFTIQTDSLRRRQVPWAKQNTIRDFSESEISRKKNSFSCLINPMIRTTGDVHARENHSLNGQRVGIGGKI